MDLDHNRWVVTFAGPEAVAMLPSAARQGSRVDRYDPAPGSAPQNRGRRCSPFRARHSVSLGECVTHRQGRGEQSGGDTTCRSICTMRRRSAKSGPQSGGPAPRRFEGLREEALSANGTPAGLGEPGRIPPPGRAVGARKFLIAYNINLATPEVEIARRIARKIRHSSGGFRTSEPWACCSSRGDSAQVSMNLTDFDRPVDWSSRRWRARRPARCARSPRARSSG